MKKIKVLQCFGALNIGGAETLMMNLLKKIDMEKFQLDFLVFSSEIGVYEKEVSKYGCKIYRLHCLSQVGIKEYVVSIKNLIIQNGGYDIVHSHMDWLGGLIVYAAYKAGVKRRIVHSHAIQDIFDDSFIKHIAITLSKLLIKYFATDYIACSNLAAESLFIDSKRTIILKNAIDLERLKLLTDSEKQVYLSKYGLTDDKIILGNIGGMSTNKNQIFLIKILEELNKKSNKYILFLIGNGPDEKILKEYVEENNITNVIFEDKTTKINIYLSLFNIFLFPSYREGLGMIVLEAQAMGLPCIISNTIPDSVDIGGNLIKKCSLNNKSEWINSILTCKQGKKNIGEMKKLIIEHGYDIDTTVKQLQKIYEVK